MLDALSRPKASQNKLLGDLLFFIVVVCLPSSFFNFVDRSIFFDLNVIFLLVGTTYLISYFRYLPKITRIAGGRLLLFVVCFLFFKLFHSIVIKDISIIETFTIFRTNFFYPVATLGFLLYAAQMNNERIYRFFYWVCQTAFIFSVVYLISNFSGIDLYAKSVKEYQNFDGTKIVQNLLSIPQYNFFLYCLALYSAIFKINFSKNRLWLVPLLVTFISIVRNQMALYLAIFLCMYGLGIISKLKVRSISTLKIFGLLLLGVVILSTVFSSHIGRVFQKFSFDQSGASIDQYLEQGTFKVRLDIIEEAYERTSKNGNLFLGNGYIREAEKGNYDFVVGTDTYIAPVLWAEGIFGLIIRLLPVIYFLIFSIKKIRSSNESEASYSIIIASLVIPSIFNSVQTIIFTHYHLYIFIFYLMMMASYNTKLSADKN